jgi:hypothetical protein
MSTQIFFESSEQSESIIAKLEQAVRDAVMHAHVSALNEMDSELRRSAGGGWASSLNLVCNFTSNLMRSRGVDVHRGAALQKRLAA